MTILKPTTVAALRLSALMLAVLSALWAASAQAASAQAASPQAPFGDKVSAAIKNYNRATPHIATSGKYDPAAIAELKALGFTAVLDLRAQSEEGAPAVAEAARTAGLKYFNIQITTKAPTEAQVAEFAHIAEDPANYPMLVSCVSANRSGAMWALYRASKGVDAMVAIEEGHTLGLKPSREKAVRARLGMAPLTE